MTSAVTSSSRTSTSLIFCSTSVSTEPGTAAGVQWGIPWVAEALAWALPARAGEWLGEGALESLDKLILEPSQLGEAEQARWRRTFAGLVPPDDPTRPWRAPLAVRAAFRFEPARVATMRANELADTVLAGFRRAVEGLHRP